MKHELHLMIDLETLSTRMNAVILEVGYAVFETQAEQVNRSGRWYLDINDQTENKRAIDWSSLCWWIDQATEAQQAAFKGVPRLSVNNFIREFRDLQWHNFQGIWSHGAGFDIPILEDLHRQYGAVAPWHYHTPRDTRTLFWLSDLSQTEWVQPTLKHSAEADAIAQAMTVQRALKKLENRI